MTEEKRSRIVAALPLALMLLIISTVVLLTFWADRAGRRRASRQVACLSNLKHIMTAIKTYSPDYGECNPTSAPRGKEINVETHYRDLGILYPTYMSSLEMFTCPSTRDRMPRPRKNRQYRLHLNQRGDEVFHAHKPFLDEEADQVSYAYSYNGAAGRNLVWTEAAPSTTIILADRHANRELTSRSNHKREGRNVAFQDGHAEWISGSERLLTDPENPDPNIRTQCWWSERRDRTRK